MTVSMEGCHESITQRSFLAAGPQSSISRQTSRRVDIRRRHNSLTFSFSAKKNVQIFVSRLKLALTQWLQPGAERWSTAKKREREGREREGGTAANVCPLVLWWWWVWIQSCDLAQQPETRGGRREWNVDGGGGRHCHGDLLTRQCLLTSPNLTVAPRGHRQGLRPLPPPPTPPLCRPLPPHSHTHTGRITHNKAKCTKRNFSS